MRDTDGDDSIDQGPAGGRTWDGRVQSAHDQARLPLLSPSEMANASSTEVVTRARAAAYAGRIRDVFGDSVFDDPQVAFNALLLALEVFQQSPEEFYPYRSRYDAYLRGQTSLTAQELRGLEAFDDPARGNCASCHPSALKEGRFPAFTDFGYVALGVPRNRDLAANRDPRFFDLGLCGPLRADLAGRAEFCGMFRTPSLRNVALHGSFFHNGAFHTLERVLDFYAERDLAPEKWYPRGADGTPMAFDDLPARYRENVNHDAPFDRRPGERPALSRAERDDIIAFLRTLTDEPAPPIGISVRPEPVPSASPARLPPR
jgi:cytochrome c peroxidase